MRKVGLLKEVHSTNYGTWYMMFWQKNCGE